MRAINYIKPESVFETLGLLQEYGNRAKCIAGGTDIIIAMRYNTLPQQVAYLIDISSLKELSEIREEGDEIIIGAGTTHTEIEENRLLQDFVPFLCSASRAVGSPQIRNRGTVGGNLVTSAQCADTIPPLMVLEASLVLRSTKGERILTIGDFLTGPKKTAITVNELLVEIRFQKPPRNAKGIFTKLIRREAVAKSRISVAALAQQDSTGVVTILRLAPGSVTPKPSRFSTVESLLLGSFPGEEEIQTAARAASEYMISSTGRRWSTPYKEPVLQTLIARALHSILEVNNG